LPGSTPPGESQGSRGGRVFSDSPSF
jgi:hypothetical protein